MPPLSTSVKRTSIILAVVSVAFYLYGLGKIPLVGPDEPRYAQVAREMFINGDFVTPTLGGHTWFEKPALLYWMMIVAFRFFGVSEYSARLGPALCGLLTILAVWTTASRIERKSGPNRFAVLSGLVTATSLGMIVFSRAASFDVVLTMTTAWTLCLFLLWELSDSDSRSKLLLIGFYSLIGLSLIAKGLIGIVIPLGVLFVYYLLRRSWPSRSFLWSLFWGIPLAVVISSIWYGPVIARHGWSFIEEFFIQHHFARYVSNKYHHPQPVYFYISIIGLLTLPWTAYLIEALARARHWSWRSEDCLSRARVFSFAWLVLPLLFFSFSGSKLPGYILPVLPASSLLIGDRMAQGDSKWGLRGTCLICLILALGWMVFASRSGSISAPCAIAAALPFGAVSFFGLVKNEDVGILAVGGAVLLALIIGLNCAALPVAQRESVRNLLILADQRGYGNAPVFAREGSERTAEFYAATRVVYDHSGELVILESSREMLDAAIRNKQILVFIPVDQIVVFSKLPEVELIGQNGNVALLGIRKN